MKPVPPPSSTPVVLPVFPKPLSAPTVVWVTPAAPGPTFNGFSTKDRIYTPMPLYHSSALFLCIGASLYSGTTVIIGRKFSARKYWEEVRTHNATVVQYIGEIARYLLAVPSFAQG